MTRLVNRVHIQRPCADVYRYVSTPAHWPEWHPSSLRLESGAERPLPAGARFEEEILAAGRKGHLSWVVREARPGRRWVAGAVAADGSLSLTLTYELSEAAGGTDFVRTLDYVMLRLGLKLLEPLLLRRRIAAESALSLEQLKTVMESRAAAVPAAPVV